MAESTLESEAARMAAITSPTVPGGKTCLMKYGKIWSVSPRRCGRERRAGSKRTASPPTRASATIQIVSLIAVIKKPLRASPIERVVWNRWIMT